jgi:hypothetical protein
MVSIIVVVAAVILAAVVVAAAADSAPQVLANPDRIQKGKTTMITVTLDQSIPNQAEIKHVRIGGLVIDVKEPEAGKLSVPLPGLEKLGKVDLQVLGKDDKLVATSQLTYVESTAPPSIPVSPDHIQKGKATTLTLTLGQNIADQKEIKHVRLGGLAIAVKEPEGGKLSVPLPGLDQVGSVEVQVLGKDDQPVATGQLTFVESEAPSGISKGLLFLYMLLIILLPVSCTIYDIYKSYRERDRILDLLKSVKSTDEIKSLLSAMDEGPTGLVGLTRGMIAVTLILVLAFAVFHLIVFTPSEVPDLAEKLLMLLAGTLTAITGFYFGSKAATATGGTPPAGAGKQVSPVTPKIDQVVQGTGADSRRLTITGEGFGAPSDPGTITVDGQPGLAIAVGKWDDKKIEATLNGTVQAVKVKIVVKKKDGTASDPSELQLVAV